MKLAISFTSKNRVDLTKQTWLRLREAPCAAFWADGSSDPAAIRYFEEQQDRATIFGCWGNVTGGADRAIVFALTNMLQHPAEYTHIGLLENDVLLDEDWYEPTIALFDNQEGLPVGAATARSYADRILIQRDGYCVLHNAGAGMIIFTREAAQIILQNYRTGWWSENRSVFAQLSGLDIGKWAAFHHNEQMITADWSWDTILAAHGLATVALTPSKASMIGQEIPLHQQGLELTQGPVEERRDEGAFDQFCDNLISITQGWMNLPAVDWQLRTGNSTMIFPHHLAKLGGEFTEEWRTRWSQGFGPFSYVAPAGGALFVPVFGACAFHVSNGKVTIRDEATGYHTEADLPPGSDSVSIPVPRDLQYGTIRLEFSPGAVFHGIETSRSQPWRPAPFDYNSLPPVEEKTHA